MEKYPIILMNHLKISTEARGTFVATASLLSAHPTVPGSICPRCPPVTSPLHSFLSHFSPYNQSIQPQL